MSKNKGLAAGTHRPRCAEVKGLAADAQRYQVFKQDGAWHIIDSVHSDEIIIELPGSIHTVKKQS